MQGGRQPKGIKQGSKQRRRRRTCCRHEKPGKGRRCCLSQVSRFLGYQVSTNLFQAGGCCRGASRQRLGPSDRRQGNHPVQECLWQRLYQEACSHQSSLDAACCWREEGRRGGEEETEERVWARGEQLGPSEEPISHPKQQLDDAQRLRAKLKLQRLQQPVGKQSKQVQDSTTFQTVIFQVRLNLHLKDEDLTKSIAQVSLWSGVHLPIQLAELPAGDAPVSVPSTHQRPR